MILQLTGVNGSKQFDKLTRTKTVESILTAMDADGIKSYVLSLLGQLNSPKDSAEYADSYGEHDADQRNRDIDSIGSLRTWIADQFSALVRNGSVPKSDEWIQIILDWYVVNGLFTIRKKSESSPIRAVSIILSLFKKSS